MRCSTASASTSTAELGSSSTSTRARCSSARAIVSSCRWPAEKLEPPSLSGASSCLGSAAIASRMLTPARAVQISPSLWRPSGSSDLRSGPENSTGVCVMMARRERRVDSGMEAMSTPSMATLPS